MELPQVMSYLIVNVAFPKAVINSRVKELLLDLRYAKDDVRNSAMSAGRICRAFPVYPDRRLGCRIRVGSGNQNLLQVFIGRALNCEVHVLRFARVLLAAASLASICAKTSSSAMPLPKRWVSWIAAIPRRINSL